MRVECKVGGAPTLRSGFLLCVNYLTPDGLGFAGVVTFATAVGRLPVSTSTMMAVMVVEMMMLVTAEPPLIHFLVLVVLQIAQILHARVAVARGPNLC